MTEVAVLNSKFLGRWPEPLNLLGVSKPAT
jgi:hypothetical protein